MRGLNYKEFTLSRIDAFIKQVELLEEVDFPYEDSADALKIISSSIRSLRTDIENSVLNPDGLKSLCSLVNKSLSDFHRYIGYIKKSYDPRNSFEIYFSFRRLVQSVFDIDAKLIVSSEWDYNLTFFPEPADLQNFTFIGLPVAESENPLIVPLSGHELGHSIWIRHEYYKKYARQIHAILIRDLAGRFERKELGTIAEVCRRKCAEYFCDFIAIGLFGESFLFAFAYLLSPKIGNQLNATHPSAAHRADAMTRAMKKMKFSMPSGFDELFKTNVSIPSSRQEQLLDEAETLSFAFIDEILDDAEHFLVTKNLLYKRCASYSQVVTDFLEMIPTIQAETLADITNAAWEVYFDDEGWKDVRSLTERTDFLRELTVKSFEILEVNQKLSAK